MQCRGVPVAQVADEIDLPFPVREELTIHLARIEAPIGPSIRVLACGYLLT